MAITQEDIFIGSYYRTQFGEVREVTGIVGTQWDDALGRLKAFVEE